MARFHVSPKRLLMAAEILRTREPKNNRLTIWEARDRYKQYVEQARVRKAAYIFQGPGRVRIRILGRGCGDTAEKGCYRRQKEQIFGIVLLREPDSRYAVIDEVLERACDHVNMFCHLCANRMHVALHGRPSELVFIFLKTICPVLFFFFVGGGGGTRP